MKIRATFKYKGKTIVAECKVEYLIRNYFDEPYAYFFKKFGKGGVFEINILKDAEIDGNLLHDGYVNVFPDWEADCDEPSETINDCKIEFIHNA